jgi:hypothetical protein
LKLAEVKERLELEPRADPPSPDIEVTGGHVSDLLSEVMANSAKGDMWITLQTHQNIIAVASLKEHSAVVIVAGREPESETIEKAKSEKIALFSSRFSAYELAGRLYELGLRPARDEGV